MHILKLILPASEIPGGETVTKLTGKKEYVLKREVRMFAEPKADARMQPITAVEGTAFLVHEGDINVISGSTELVWLVCSDDLKTFIEGLEEGTPQ